MSTLIRENLLRENSDHLLFSAGHRLVNTYRIIPSIATTDSCTPAEIFARYLVAASDMTTSGVTPPSTPEVTQRAINELRRLSGLTWDQLAKLFNVSRRSLHSWASGERLRSFNEENLHRLLGTIQYIDRGNASLNRGLLLQPSSDGRSFLDLLVAGEHETVKRILGPGNALQKLRLGALSEDVSQSRMPPNPADRVDALQDTIHQDVGRSRGIRARRSRKNSSGQ